MATPSRLVTQWAADVVNRYSYCLEMHTPAYAGDYDEQPAWWIEAVRVIKQERDRASNTGVK